MALAAGHKDVVRLLTVNNDDDTPLHNAALRGNKEIVELLMVNGADASAKDSTGRTPAEEAARRGHNDIIELLRKQQTTK